MKPGSFFASLHRKHRGSLVSTTDQSGGSFGRRSYRWTLYDGTGKVIQTQRDFGRAVLLRAQDVNDLLSAITADGGTAPFAPVGGGTSHLLAWHFSQLQGAVQGLWTAAALGSLPPWSSGLTPGGQSLGTTQTPVYLSDLVDLRRWLNYYEQATGKAVHGWSSDAGTLTLLNRTYDARGLLQKQSVAHLLVVNVPGQFQPGDWASPVNQSVTTSYDALGRPLTRVQPDGLATFRWSYSGWSVTLVDENNHQKVQTNDVLGRLTRVQDYTGTYPSATPFQTAVYSYTVADQLTSVEDATALNLTSRVYDAVGRLLSQSDPDLGSWSYVYNPIGTLASLTDAKGQTISYAYDNLDRLSSKSGTGLAVTYTYDSGVNGKGRRSLMTDGVGTATYGYDQRGRLTSLTRVINGQSYLLSTTYDVQDRVATLTYPNGDTLSYWYVDNGRPVTLLLNGNVVLVNGATYTQLNQLATLTLGNGLTTQYHYYALDVTPPAGQRMVRATGGHCYR